MWPAWYLNPPWAGMEGTTYVSGGSLGAIIHGERYRGQAWRLHGQWTSYRPSSRRMYKAMNRLHLADEADFWNIMRSCEQAHIKPPTSHVDCFRGMAKLAMMPRKSVVAKLHGAAFGGWQAAFCREIFRGKVYKYDLNKAYRWAACQGLPDLHTAYYLDKYEDEPFAVYDCMLPKGAIPYWPRGRERGYVTTEELERFKVLPLQVFGGVAFVDRVDFGPIFRQIDHAFPFCHNRISRAFWGLWNSRTGPEQCSWKDGTEKVHSMQNPFYNPIWSLYVTSRVKLRIAEILPVALHCQVDAVLTKEPLPTGTEPGEWRLEGEYPEYIGAWIGPHMETRLHVANGREIVCPTQRIGERLAI